MAHTGVYELKEGWQYRWGDSPFTDQGQPSWALEDTPTAWHDIDFPSNPPARSGRTNVWYRVTLPEGNWNDPVLYIYSVDLIVEVYYQGDRIYHYGTFDADGKGRFEGWPWHAIDLPEGFAGQPLYFRVYSNYSDIGLWGEVKVLGRQELYLYILGHSIEALVIAGFCGLIALLALVFALVQSERRSFASIALFSFSTGAMLLGESQANLLILNTPLFWDYVAAGSYFMLPVAIGLMLSQWLANTRPMVIGWIWKFHLGYVVLALTAALTGMVDLSDTFPVFDALFAVTTILLFGSIIRRWQTVNTEQRLIIGCYAVLALLLMLDMAVAHGVLPWGRVPVSVGALAFSIAIVAISLFHYSRTQQALHLLNHTLENKVSERTERLERLAHQEQVRVRQLSLENERTRFLNDLIAELQDCKSLKEGYALWTSRLPRLCMPMSGRAYGRLDDRSELLPMAEWGSGKDEIVTMGIEALTTLPAPSRITGPVPGGEDDTRAGVGGAPEPPWCLHLYLQDREHGSFIAGLVLLEPPEASAGEPLIYNPVQSFLSLEQAVQKVAITLSTLSLREELERLSYEDPLTGLKNRRFFEEILGHELAMARRHELPMSLLIIDIDFFKRFNDLHGHPAGDEALRAVSRVLMEQVRDSDVVCRVGGEEFVVLMPGSAEYPALDRAELLRRAVAELSWTYNGQPVSGLTISVGVATWPETTADTERLFQVADEALYRAKQNGRNCVSAA